VAVKAGKEGPNMNTTFRVSLGLALLVLGGSLHAQSLDQRAPSVKPKTYGLDQISYYRIAASEFTLVDTSYGFLYADEWYTDLDGRFERYAFGATGQFVASPHLPSGALVTYFELDSCDEDPVNDVMANLYLCDILGNCGNAVQQLSSNNNAISCGYTSADVSAAGIQVDNYRNQVTVLVQTSGGHSTRFAGAILGYKLQVSPPPLFSDFNDVPTSSPQFRFIEALYNAGVTAGCGGGNYCPNNPVTRGQMAVFLAKALGLQWP
jgi:hypothetical protein